MVLETYRPIATPVEIFERTLRLIEGLCAVGSPSGDRDGLCRANEVLGSALAERGLAVHVEQRPGAGGALLPVLHARGARAEGRYLLLIGHMDTVLTACTPERRGERLLATGAIDMKGGLATLAGALDLLAADGRRAPADLRLAVVPDEEVAGPICAQMVRELGAAARELWVLEPGEPVADEEQPAETMVVGRRGCFFWRLEIAGRSAHAGNAFWQGRSALLAAAAWSQRAFALARPGRGPLVNVGRLVAAEAGFVEHLAARAELVGTPRGVNVVPDAARVDGQARFLAAGEAAELVAALEQLTATIAREHEVRARLEVGEILPPVDPEGPGAARSRRAVELAAARGWSLRPDGERGGISFPNFLNDPSAIPVLDGLGPAGGGMHTREEFLDLRSLDRRIRLLADLLADDAAG